MINKVDNRLTKQKLIVYIILTVVTLAVYWQVNLCGFVNLDDYTYVIENDHVQSGITLDGLRWAFSTTYAEFWHPLTWLSLMLDNQLYGASAGGYHVTNLILHILSTLLLFWLFCRMTGAIWRSALVAALFALHPFHVESVAWISERKDVLSAFFWMLTLCLYVYYTEKPIIKRYLPVVISFVLALMSKPMVVTLPLILLLLDYWPLNRLESRKTAIAQTCDKPVSANKEKKKNKGKLNATKENMPQTQIQKLPESKIAGIIPVWQLWEKIPFFILSAIFSILTIYAQPKTRTIRWQHGLESRIMNAIVSFGTYLAKTVWPYDMAVFYPYSGQLPLWQMIIAIIAIIAISAAVILMVKRLPFLFTGWLWFIITLGPVIGIIQVGDFAYADRYHYLPSIGIAVMLAWGIPSLIKREEARKMILFPAGIIFLLILTILTWQQCGYWSDSGSLFSHALRVTKDNYLAHYSLSETLMNEGKSEEAIYHDSEAIRLKPDCAMAYYNRGVVYNKLGQYQQAIEDFSKAVSVEGDYADAYYNRGVDFTNIGQYQRAIEDFKQTIRLNPAYYTAYNNMAGVYLQHGDKELGCDYAQKACARGLCRALQWAHENGLCR
ncbi:MAG TPA: tetratricopeptide repeat protein [Smithella sp.]|nr:tetratricopeptide repeat protein [Smithella sp.]